MAHVRIKGVKIYKSKGRTYAYHRATGMRLKAEIGTGEFFEELAALERKTKREETKPGTLGMLFASYRSTPSYQDLAAASRSGYSRMMGLLQPLDAMPLVELTPLLVAGLRDKIADRHGRRQANYALAVLSIACENGRELGLLRDNPVRGIKRLRRQKGLKQANRPWTSAERRIVLEQVPAQLKVPIALAMFTGLRKSDILQLQKGAIRNGLLHRETNKTGRAVDIPIHPDLATILATAPQHDAITVAATTFGKPWTESGFNSSFIKAIARLKREGLVEDGLTFHGLRHTVGTLLTEAGVDLDVVRRWLGQKTMAMAIHYSETANISKQMTDALSDFDPLGSKTGTRNV